MGKTIEFTSNYEDLSTDNGFQFEFRCDRCGGGYRSTFKKFALGSAAGVLGAAGDIFGGFLSTASNVGERVKSAKWEQKSDEAFEEAAKEVMPNFAQCPKCQAWVCLKSCWNKEKGLCKECAPDLGVEMAAAQANKSVEEIRAHAEMADEDKKLGKENWKENIVATCPQCQKPLAKNAKFCPECGFKLHSDDKCQKCGAKLSPNAKFCPECGEKIS